MEVDAEEYYEFEVRLSHMRLHLRKTGKIAQN